MGGLRGVEAKRAALLAAQEATDFLRLRRTPPYAQDLDGFVVGGGTKWALLAATRNGGYRDGWVAIRIGDVRRIRVKNHSFERTVAPREAWWPPSPPLEIGLDRTTDLLAAVPPQELIGIEKERERSALWIGRVTELEPGTVWLHEVDPEARWSREAGYRLGAITKVRLRTEYLTALDSVTPRPGPAPAP